LAVARHRLLLAGRLARKRTESPLLCFTKAEGHQESDEKAIVTRRREVRRDLEARLRCHMPIHKTKSSDPFAALEPIAQGVLAEFGSVEAGTARGLKLRLDHGSQYLSDHFQKQIKAWGMVPSFAFIEQPQNNGVAERFFRTLKEQVVYGRVFETIEDLRQAVGRFVELYNSQWILEKNGYLSPLAMREACFAEAAALDIINARSVSRKSGAVHSLVHLKLPSVHRKNIRTTNLVERSFSEERRRAKVIPRFRGEKECLKLVFAALWRASERRQRVRFTDIERKHLDKYIEMKRKEEERRKRAESAGIAGSA